MKIKIEINKNGQLLIERGLTMRLQKCPFNSNGHGCGDWCPLFDDSGLLNKNFPILNLCHTTYYLYSVKDDRDKYEQ